jgi:hypothetical protein
MVRIRYSELPAGLHVIARAERRGTVVYLQPGLTPAQRRAALGRARSSAHMGRGPALPATQMAIAIAADRVRTTASYGVAAARGHPMLLLPPLVGLVSVAMVFALMSLPTPPADSHAKFAPGGAATLAVGAGGQRTSSSPPPTVTAGPRHIVHRTRAARLRRWRMRHRLAPPPAGVSSSPSPSPTSPSPTPEPSPSAS